MGFIDHELTGSTNSTNNECIWTNNPMNNARAWSKNFKNNEVFSFTTNIITLISNDSWMLFKWELWEVYIKSLDNWDKLM